MGGDVKNSIGNVEAKELICMTHGHELKGGECRWEGNKGKNGTTVSIINKIYFKLKKEFNQNYDHFLKCNA